MNNVGIIYAQIASTCLTKRYPDMPESDRKLLLECGNLEKIEKQIGAKNLIESAATAISDFLYRLGYQYHATTLMRIALHSKSPVDDLKKVKGVTQFDIYLEESKKAELVLETLKSIHKKWVEDNMDQLFDPEHVGERYMFTSLYLIGFEEAMRGYIFIRPILQLLGLEPNPDTVKLAYQSAQQETALFVENPVVMLDNEFPELTKDLSMEEKNDIVRQIMDRSPEIFHWKR